MSLFACVAALIARKTGRAAKLRLDRDDDMRSTGKRHAFAYWYDVGFDGQGRILGLDLTLASRCGFSADLSGPVNDRAVFHCDNTYWLPDIALHSFRCKTNTVSDTAFRGFGGPQGMFPIEHVIDEIAMALRRDPLDVRVANLYGTTTRNSTPYGMTVEDNIAPAIVARLEVTSRYRERRAQIAQWNRANPIVKRGIALTPVKFGISFTATHYNQAGALLHLYNDGALLLNHGGTEMGQGLFVKVAQVVAQELGVPLATVRVSASDTSNVPNASPTAASSGSDLNGMAARDAARTLRERLADFAARKFDCDPGIVEFAGGMVTAGHKTLPFAELARAAYFARVQLSATGFYATPKIHYDRKTLSGRPFFYFAYGAAVSEVALDTLTGEHRLLAVDILHDAGSSLNPAIDRGQIEGGFIQGYGWLAMEELWWNDKGELRTFAPSTYKIPTAHDVPKHFRIDFFDEPNREDTIYRSKAVGEPPFMLAFSAFHALRDAVASCASHEVAPQLDAPATDERLLAAIADVRTRARVHAR
jgi:xanthine dehydrogenase large subunit